MINNSNFATKAFKNHKILYFRHLQISIMLFYLLLIFFGTGCKTSGYKKYLQNSSIQTLQEGGAIIVYPADSTIIPPDLQAPTFMWTYNKELVANWYVCISSDKNIYIDDFVQAESWKPDSAAWEKLKRQHQGVPFQFTVIGQKPDGTYCSASTSLSISKDSVGADIFFRAVTLPFSFAVKNVHTIEWYLGSVKGGKPKKMLDNMPVCANCHSFSGGGKLLALDVDYGNDKGSYAITETADTATLTPEKIISWSDYKRESKDPTFGLLSQISPNGQYVLSTVKDLSVFVAVDNNLAYSQLFFPIKGIIGTYNVSTKTFGELQGANDPKLVQSNPSWSPDGTTVVFARTQAYVSEVVKTAGKALLSSKDIDEFFAGHKQFKFDLYTVSFNNGKGGEPVPLEGAYNNGKSNYFPKFSPNGKWIVFCQANNFMLLQPDSRLYILPSKGGKPRLMKCNLDSMNSWHSWSPNSKWLVFSSKHRGLYTQLYMTHIDENGNDSPPVLLENLLFDKRAANIPEFYTGKASAFNNIKDAFSNTAASYTAIASDYMTNKLYKRAWSNLEKAIKLDSNYYEAYYSQILLNASLKQANSITDRKAKNKLSQLTESLILKTPHDEQLQITRATLNTLLGKNEIAKQQALDVLKYNPQSYKALELLASICRKTGEYNELLAYYKKMIAQNPGSKRQIEANIAELFAKMGNNKLAMSKLDELINQNPQNSDLLINKIGLLLSENKTEAALQLCENIKKFEPSNILIYQMAGQALLAVHKKHEAAKNFQKAIDLIRIDIAANIENIDLYLKRAEISTLNGEYKDALLDYEKVLALFPENYEALKQKAKILLMLQNWDLAIKIYEVISKNYPAEEEIFNNQAIAYINIGNYNMALQMFDQTLAINPKNSDAIFNRNKLLKMMPN